MQLKGAYSLYCHLCFCNEQTGNEKIDKTLKFDKSFKLKDRNKTY
jgi:hypothetical protein